MVYLFKIESNDNIFIKTTNNSSLRNESDNAGVIWRALLVIFS